MAGGENIRTPKAGLPRVNFRPLLFCALSLAGGILFYGKARFGGFTPADLLFFLLFLPLSLPPRRAKRLLAIAGCVLLFAGAGVGVAHWNYCRFTFAQTGGSCSLAGTVRSVTVYDGYTFAVMDELFLDGEAYGGKCRVSVSSEEIRPGDELLLQAVLSPVLPEMLTEDYLVRSFYAADVRYTATATSWERTGRSADPFLKLNAAIYDCLHSHLESETADVGYALLTGNSGGMEEDFSDAVKKGGIAHIFAVSGLHIGILFGAAYALCRPLGKFRIFPAIALALCYSALCGFTVSSVRAVVMCSALGAVRAAGRKYDFLHSVSLAALLVLLFFPAQWYSAGFRLSFGACIGLALFSAPLSRLFARLHFPDALCGYLGANLGAQAFTAPLLLDSFGYLSVWGTLVNLIVVPLLPVLFLGLVVCTALALVLPFAAGFFLLFPDGMLSLLIFAVTAADFSLVLTGFALGGGTAVWITGCCLLSDRVRMKRSARAVGAVFAAFAFAACVVAENIVFSGCTILVYTREDGSAALIRTREECVLVIDGEISLSECEDFLARSYGGRLTAVAVLSEESMDGINTAAFLNTECVYSCRTRETGLRETDVRFGESFSCGELFFRYIGESKLLLFAESLAVELDFDGEEALGADLFVGSACGGLKYFLKDDIIGTR